MRSLGFSGMTRSSLTRRKKGGPIAMGAASAFITKGRAPVADPLLVAAAVGFTRAYFERSKDSALSTGLHPALDAGTGDTHRLTTSVTSPPIAPSWGRRCSGQTDTDILDRK